MSFLVVAAITVGGNLLAGKIASNRAKDPKAAIGSGTAPSLQPGGDIEVSSVEGSQVQDFGDFESENMAMSDEMSKQEQLLAYLASQGISPEEFGIMGAAMGGPLYKANGGGIDALLKQLGIDVESLTAPSLEGVVDFTKIEMPKPEDLMEDQMFSAGDLSISKDDLIVPEIGQEQTMMQEISNYAGENPEMFNAGIGAITKVLSAALSDAPERKGSIVSTQTLPGNSARRRSAQMNIQPIGGSKVTFANEGTALKRPMFMPHGGQMRGPGGPKDDLIPVMASNGEYMLSKAAVDAAGDGSHAKGLARLDAFNKMGNKRYG